VAAVSTENNKLTFATRLQLICNCQQFDASVLMSAAADVDDNLDCSGAAVCIRRQRTGGIAEFEAMADQHVGKAGESTKHLGRDVSFARSIVVTPVERRAEFHFLQAERQAGQVGIIPTNPRHEDCARRAHVLTPLPQATQSPQKAIGWIATRRSSYMAEIS
jgi:hypothetical protein